MFQKEQVDPLQMKLQQVNGLGQGLIQSAGKNCDVQGLEHDMEEINVRWNTLNKKVSDGSSAGSNKYTGNGGQRNGTSKSKISLNINKNLAVAICSYIKGSVVI